MALFRVTPARVATIAALLLVATGACKGEAGGMQHESQMPGSPPDVASDLVTSGNIVQLDQFTFYPSIADGRVWFVEFYVPWCRGCKRLADQWVQLADELATTNKGIVVARFDCDRAEDLCDVLNVSRTPTLKVYFQGADVETYKADFLHIDLFKPFIMRMYEQLTNGPSSPTTK